MGSIIYDLSLHYILLIAHGINNDYHSCLILVSTFLSLPLRYMSHCLKLVVPIRYRNAIINDN